VLQGAVREELPCARGDGRRRDSAAMESAVTSNGTLISLSVTATWDYPLFIEKESIIKGLITI
jgi:hypothetical protein